MFRRAAAPHSFCFPASACPNLGGKHYMLRPDKPMTPGAEVSLYTAASKAALTDFRMGEVLRLIYSAQGSR